MVGEAKTIVDKGNEKLLSFPLVMPKPIGLEYVSPSFAAGRHRPVWYFRTDIG